MIVTFAGLLFTQFVYMENMIKMRKEQFTEAVQRSLYAVSNMLEKKETQKYLVEGLDLGVFSGDDVVGEVFLNPQLSITSPDGSVTTYDFNTLRELKKKV
jgi:hypothetical protein